MRILIAAGGTAGHINPALAIAGELQNRNPHAQIHFCGRKKGMEYALVQKAGYPFHQIEVQGIQRSLSPKNMVRNLQAEYHLAWAMPRANAILKQLQPDLVIGCGGYVSGPVVRQAAKRGIPTAIHEQNAFPGVTNKLLAKQADIVFCATQAAVERLGVPHKTVVVGNPVQPAFLQQNRAEARSGLNAGERTVVVSFGGSLGARRMNEVIATLAAWEQKQQLPILHLHATGSRGVELFAALAAQKGVQVGEGFRVSEYINDMPQLLAAADLVIGRAGALTLAELQVVGRASILIPSPNVAENHQYYNAMELQKAGAAVVLQEKELTGERLIQEVQTLLQQKGTLAVMGQMARTLAQPDSLQKIGTALERLLQKGSSAVHLP